MQSFKLFYKYFKINGSPENISTNKPHSYHQREFFSTVESRKYIVYRLQPGMLFSML
jgi:hypothetical protein